MLHIILTILKIIGILLLVLLAIILFVTAAVLFVPVRYRLNGEKEGDNLSVRAEVFWFMHLLRARALYPEPGRVIVKLLWFTLYDSGSEEKSEEKEKKQRKSKKDRETEEKSLQQRGSERTAGESITESGKEGIGKEQTADAQKIQGQKITEQRAQEQKIPEQKTQEWKKQEWKLQEQWEHRRWMEDYSGDDLEKNIGDITEDDFEEEAWEEEQAQEEPEGIGRLIKTFTKKVTGFFGKIADILRKIKNAVKNIWYTIKRLCDRIVEIRNNISYYIEVFGEEETKQAFTTCRQELKRIWKNIRPTKCRAELMLGTGEPDTTGYILAMHGILYPIIGNDIVIEPDFENQVLEGKLFLKGRITVFVLLYAVIKIYFDKNIRYFLKRFKREEA